MARIGVLHPGSMGISLAASVKATGHEVCWSSDGRSEQTRARAEEHGLTELDSVQTMCAETDGIVCICPPHATEQVAREVAGFGFSGIYLDANAISPEHAQEIAATISDGGAIYVDGGVIGSPAWKPDTTYLHLSGEQAAAVADWFRDGLVVTNLLGNGVSEASAIKMCFAAYTKGTTALFYGILATSEAFGVREALIEEWSRRPGLADMAERAEGSAGGMTAKAWRWVDEMEQISQTFEAAGLHGGFHAAAAEIFRRSAALREVEDPSVNVVLQSLLGRGA
jgi:3-hydroxyisobutyrate dehydrogenase-like beta-hydroxyacid dehydrogenase